MRIDELFEYYTRGVGRRIPLSWQQDHNDNKRIEETTNLTSMLIAYLNRSNSPFVRDVVALMYVALPLGSAALSHTPDCSMLLPSLSCPVENRNNSAHEGNVLIY